MATKKQRGEGQVIGFVGVGLDNKDDHQRITHSEHFLLVGGSQATHEIMQDTVIRFENALNRKGMNLEDTTPQEAADLLREAIDD